MMQISQGQIWVTISEMKADCREQIECESCNHVRTVTKDVTIPAGTFIEIRYAYEWHYRTIFDKYHHSDPAEILRNARMFGTVLGSISFDNKHKLSDILDEGLYTPHHVPEEGERE